MVGLHEAGTHTAGRATGDRQRGHGDSLQGKSGTGGGGRQLPAAWPGTRRGREELEGGKKKLTEGSDQGMGDRWEAR